MQNMRLLEDIFVRDPYFVRAEKGWLLFLSHDKPADDSYEGVEICFSYQLEQLSLSVFKEHLFL